MINKIKKTIFTLIAVGIIGGSLAGGALFGYAKSKVN